MSGFYFYPQYPVYSIGLPQGLPTPFHPVQSITVYNDPGIANPIYMATAGGYAKVRNGYLEHQEMLNHVYNQTAVVPQCTSAWKVEPAAPAFIFPK